MIRPNENYDDYQKRMERRADILFPTMKNKDKIKKLKNLPLGKSIYDEDDDDDSLSIKNTGKIKSELEPLAEAVKKEKNTERKSRKDRTPEEEEEILDLMYPSMKNIGKKKTSDEDNEEKPKNDKICHFTGDATDINKSSNNTDRENSNIVNKKQDNEKNSTKPVKSEDERNKDALKILGMDDTKYQIKGNTISRKEKTKDYEVINGIKYPKNTDNQKVQEMKNEVLKRNDENDSSKREKYLKSNSSKPYQYGVDNVDKSIFNLAKKLPFTRETVENLHMSKSDSYMETDYAKEHKVYNSYKDAPEELQEYLKGKISKQIGEDKLESTKGIYIDKDSDSSKSLADNLIKDNDFIKKLKNYEKPLKHNFEVDDSISLKGFNWHSAIGNADIKKMHINKNGDIELYVTDTYDFNKGERTGAPAVGRDRQEKGEIKPYFAVYHVIIPKEKYKVKMDK